MLSYIIVRSKRKTVAIRVNANGEVEVRAPKKVATELIEKFVKSKEQWIAEKVKIAKEKTEKRNEFSINEGGTLTLLGIEYPVITGEKCSFDGQNFIIPKGEFNAVKPSIISLYKKIARRVLLERVEYYSKIMGYYPTAVRINSAVTRWGSCSGKNSLNFSWKLIFAPLDVVDYVVVHELSHIKEHNHSNRFWAVVAGVLPDYKARERQLKVLQEKISIEDWK